MRVSLAAAWKTRPPRCLTAATGSMPCQNRWLGSISAPTWVALICSTSRCSVGGLKTRLCGCISMQTLTSAAAARAWMSFQNGTATWFHWWSRMSRYWLSQGLTTQFATVPPGSPAGRPDMVTTRLTPSTAATSIVRRRSSACLGPTDGFGLSGLPLTLRPVSVMPACWNLPRYSARAPALDRMSSIGRCGAAMNPPVLISALVRPSSPRILSVSSIGRSCRQAVYAPSFISLLLQLDGLVGGGHDRLDDLEVVQAVGHVRAGRELADAGDLVQERLGLVDEEVVLAVADGREVHRQALGDVRVPGPGEHRPRAVHRLRRDAVDDAELGRPGQVERRGAVLAEDVEAQRVGVPVGHPGQREGAHRLVGVAGGERTDVLVLDRRALAGELHPAGVADGHADRLGAVGDQRRHRGALHRGGLAAEELGQVEQVAADV